MFWAAHGLHCEVQQASYPGPIGLGNLLNSSRDRDRLLQLLVFNEEFLVNASHQLALITSLPFVHTARRSYRLDESMSLSEESRETTSVVDLQSKVMQICSSRGRRSRNKVSVGEPAEGSLTQNNPKNQRKPPSLGIACDPTRPMQGLNPPGVGWAPHGVRSASGPFTPETHQPNKGLALAQVNTNIHAS